MGVIELFSRSSALGGATRRLRAPLAAKNVRKKGRSPAPSGPPSGETRSLRSRVCEGHRVEGRPLGSVDRKRASATPAEPARQRRAEPSPASPRAEQAGGRRNPLPTALARGGVGTPALRWNHHARTPGGTTDSWRTCEGRGLSNPPGRRKHRRPSEARPRSAASPGGERPRREPGKSQPTQGAERPSRNVFPWAESARASVAFPSPSFTPELWNNSESSESTRGLTNEVTT